MIYIQTENGLQSLNPSLTKEKIISILGYTPANINDLPNIEEDQSGKINIIDEDGNIILTIDERGLETLDAILGGQSVVSHMSNSTIHITAAEREKWNNVEGFSGKYEDLQNVPILEDNEGNLIVADESGNIIMKVDNDGLQAAAIIANGVNLGETINTHMSNSTIHITAAEREKWNNIEGFSGDYNDLKNAPILEDNAGNLIITDEDGNIVMKVDNEGLQAAAVIADGVNLADELSALNDELDAHTGNSAIHVTTADKTNWNNKSEFDGKFSSLLDSPIEEDSDGQFIIADINGNIALKIDNEGTKSFNFIADGRDVKAHIDDDDIHVTADERTKWNNKVNSVNGKTGTSITLTAIDVGAATENYVNTKVADLVNSAPSTLDTLNELSQALGDDPNFATTVANQISQKANQSDLNTHTSNTTVHVTAAEKDNWNNKTSFSGDYKDLVNAPNIEENVETDELLVVDNNNNIIVRIDKDGINTTEITTDGVKIKDTLTKHINETDNADKLHITADERVKWNNKVNSINGKTGTSITLTYVDVGAASPTDVSNAVKDLASEDYVNEQIENIDFPVDSVNGKTGTVILTAVDVGAATQNDINNAVKDLASKTDVSNAVKDLASTSYVNQQINNIDFPVDSVNGKTGDIALTAVDVGAATQNDINNAVKDLASEDYVSNAVKDLASEDYVNEQIENIVFPVTQVNGKTGEIILTAVDVGATTEDYVNTKIANLVSSAPSTLDTLNELAQALGDDPNFATTVANQIGQKANQNDLSAHTSNNTIHVTAADKDNWNNKTSFSGDYRDLTNAPSISESEETDELLIVDNSNNIIARVDKDGMSTTEVNADGVKIKETLIKHINETDNADKLHITATERERWNNKVDATYVGNQINAIDFPIISVNNKTGAVQLTATDVGALPSDTVIPPAYSLPKATATTLGGVTIGEGITVNNGKISIKVASSTSLGGVKIGTGINIDSNGVISTVPMEVVDNLTSDATNKALSAKQGKILANADVGKKTDVSGAEIFNDYTNNSAVGSCSHAEGKSTSAIGSNTHAQGSGSIAYGTNSHAEGIKTVAYGENSHAEGIGTPSTIFITGSGNSYEYTINEGEEQPKNGDIIIYNNIYTRITGISDINSTIFTSENLTNNTITNVEVLVYHLVSSGKGSHAEGRHTIAQGNYSHAEGHTTISTGTSSHTEGNFTAASGPSSHAEGIQSFATGEASHAEGDQSVSWGKASHAEGILTLAAGEASHAGGNNCAAQGTAHFVHGLNLESNNESLYPQTIFGQYNNVKSEKKDIIFMIGCGDSTTRKNVFEINGSGDVYGERVFGAVWNDYAEYRSQAEDIEPGYCVASSRNGKVHKTTELYQACDGIVSDTFGFSIGKTDTHQLPLAVAGRVLAYCAGNREDYEVGDTVCAGPEGKVYKMTRDEVKEWPDRIVGIVSEIPEYKTWGSGNILVNNRIWIKVV